MFFLCNRKIINRKLIMETWAVKSLTSRSISIMLGASQNKSLSSVRRGVNKVISIIKWHLAIIVLSLSSQSCYAVLSATTSKSIQGSLPYFHFLGSGGSTKTKILTTDQLVGFQYIGNSGSVAFADASMASSPIIVYPTMNLDDLMALVTIDGNTYALDSVVTTSGSKLIVGDDDGDASDSVAEGALQATLYVDDIPVNAPLPQAPFSFGSKYELKIISSPASGSGKLQVKTTYGDPNVRDYSSKAVTYRLALPTAMADVLFAKPNVKYANYSSDFEGALEWDPVNGFKPQNITNPASNFPTTGFDGAFFDIKLDDAVANQVYGIKVSGHNDVNMHLIPNPSGGDNSVLRVSLRGPADGTSGLKSPPTSIHIPTTFELKMGLGGTTIYSFTVSKWFIAKPGINGVGYPYSSDGIAGSSSAVNETPNYCAGLVAGGGYRIPNIVDYTNANNIEVNWTNGLIGQENGFRRMIGGGLLAEWGDIRDVYYEDSDFDNTRYWAKESYSANEQYYVRIKSGAVWVHYAELTRYRAACVSP